MKGLNVLQAIRIITCLLIMQTQGTVEVSSSIPPTPDAQSNLDPSYLPYEETPLTRPTDLLQQSHRQVLAWGFSASTWATFTQILGEEGLVVVHSSTRPIVPSASYAAIVIEEPKSPLTTSEIKDLENYVAGGGKLVVGGDTYPGHVNLLLQEYGVTLTNDSKSGTSFTFAAGNPLFSGVSMLSTKPDYTWDGHIANVSGPSATIAWLDGTPIVAETSDSRVLALAEDEVFLDGWGVENSNNQTFIRNLAQWIGCRIYLPLIVRNYSLPIPFPLYIGDVIPVRPVAYQGEVFFTKSVWVPGELPSSGHFYFSSQQDTVAEALVDDELTVLLDGVEVFTYDFSTSGYPLPAVVEVPRATMEQLAGRTVTIKYRDVHGYVIKASEMWLIWLP